MVSVFKWIIKGYQNVSRLLLPGACRFHPSCSQYALDALDRHGLFVGIFKAFLRILRCNPFSSGGNDPVR